MDMDNCKHMVLLVLLGLTGMCLGKPAEPVCSKFSYEQETLYKMVRLEFDVEQMVKETKAVLASVQEQLTAVKQERDELRMEVANFKTKTDTVVDNYKTKTDTAVGDLKDLRESLNTQINDFQNSALNKLQETGSSLIWFLAKDPTDLTPAANEVIVYGTEVANVGGGYDSSTGKFTAPVQGLYAFSIHTCSRSYSEMNYAIKQDNTSLLEGCDRASYSGNRCTSATVYTQMDVGDSVWVTTWGGGFQFYSLTDYCNTFTGALIHEYDLRFE